MTEIETFALSKVVRPDDAKAARDTFGEGTYPVDFIVRVRGGLRVGKDNPSAKIAARIPDRAFMLWTLSKMNAATRERTVREFKAALDSGELDKLDADEIKGAWDAVLESTRGLRKGTVTHTLTAETVEAEVAEAAPEREEVPIK